MKLEQKKELVKQLKESFENAQSAVFVDFTGLAASDLDLLRSKIQESGGKLQVAKNTLIARALSAPARKTSAGETRPIPQPPQGKPSRFKDSNLEGWGMRRFFLARSGNQLEGPTAIVFSFSDPLSPIKALVSFREEFEIPEIKGGFFEGNPISAEKVFELSQIPGRSALLSQLVGSLNAPLQRFVLTASNPVRMFVAEIQARIHVA